MSLLLAGLVTGGISALANGVGTIASNNASKRAYNASQEAMDRKEARLTNWRNRIVNEDYTQSATSQGMITKLGDMMRNRNQAIAGQNAVSGGTTAAAAAQKEQSNQVLADTARQIAASGDERKDRADQTYMSGMMNIDDQRAQVETERAKQQAAAIQAAASGVGQAAGNFLSAYAMQGGTSSDKATLNTGK